MISMNDFRAEPAELQRDMLQACQRVIASGWYVLGSEVQAFESEWAAASRAAFAVGVANGLDAIEIALRALGIGPGDEVITTPMTAFATVLGILRAGAVPVLADIEPGSGLLSVASAQRCVSVSTKAVLLVHLYGQVRDMDRWQAFCADHRLILVEDCAQSHLATWRGTGAGSFGAAGACSFYPTKNLGALGDAGALICNDGELAKRAARLRNYGQSVRYHHPEIGMNSRLDEMQAALLRTRLAWLPSFTARRRQIAQVYAAQLRNPAVRLPDAPQEADAHVHHLFVVNCDQRDALQAHLREQGIEALIHYPVPVHQQEPCRAMRRDPQGLQASDEHARTCLSLPCHPQLSDDDVGRVILAVNGYAPG
jgi:dTDP-4-amino-4,6-dideoxygalactose transaminase